MQQLMRFTCCSACPASPGCPGHLVGDTEIYHANSGLFKFLRDFRWLQCRPVRQWRLTRCLSQHSL